MLKIKSKINTTLSHGTASMVLKAGEERDVPELFLPAIRSSNGAVELLTQGVTTAREQEIQADLAAANAAVTDEVDPRVEDIKAAIVELSQNPENLTAKKQVKTEILEEYLGFDVSAAERDSIAATIAE